MNKSITLGERQYQLGELPLRKATAYRERLKTELGQVAALFDQAPETDITNPNAVGTLLKAVSTILMGSVDTVTELLLDYSDALGKDREYILDNAVGSQVVDAFIVVLTLVFPFFEKERWNKLQQLIGSNSAQTSTN